MIELGEDAQGLGVGKVSFLNVFVHIVDEVLDSYLGGSISN